MGSCEGSLGRGAGGQRFAEADGTKCAYTPGFGSESEGGVGDVLIFLTLDTPPDKWLTCVLILVHF